MSSEQHGRAAEAQLTHMPMQQSLVRQCRHAADMHAFDCRRFYRAGRNQFLRKYCEVAELPFTDFLKAFVLGATG